MAAHCEPGGPAKASQGFDQATVIKMTGKEFTGQVPVAHFLLAFWYLQLGPFYDD